MSSKDRLERTGGLALLAREVLRVRSAIDESEHRNAVCRLVHRMGSLRGLPQKVGQMLALVGGEQPSEPRAAFADLLETGEPVPIEEFSRWCRESLGEDRFRAFRWIHPDGRAASIGQVHEGRLTSDDRVAIKAQYPGIAEALSVDIAALGLLSTPLRYMPGKRALVDYDLAAYRQVLGEALLRETDYQAELATLERFHARLQGSPHVAVPRPWPELCSTRVLTMSWMDGLPIHRLTDTRQTIKDAIGWELVSLFLQQWLSWGEAHSDPHAGNYRFHCEGTNYRVAILDFGCVHSLTALELFAFQRMLRVGPGDEAATFEAFCQLGFSPDLLEPLRRKLPSLVDILLRPFRYRGPFDVRQWNLRREIETLLADDRWNFRLAGPPSLTLFIRSFAGLLEQLRTLGARVDWQTCLSGLAEGSLQPAEKTILPMSHQAELSHTQLHILVREGDETKVRITLPGHAVQRLDELIPPEVLERLHRSAVQPAQIGQQAFLEGCVPQELFCLTTNERCVRVWLA